MNHPTRLKTTTSRVLIILSLVCFGLLPKVEAVSPAPDGGYPGFNTAEGEKALFSLTTGVANTANGWFSLFSNTDGSFNTAVGTGTLLFNVGDQSTFEGVDNTAIGTAALLFNSTGADNTGVGMAALVNNADGVGNTGVGAFALEHNTIGSLNIALGINAGNALTTGNNNIDIGNNGVADESATIRIGSVFQTRAFIAGISGVPVTGTGVVVAADGQLGVAPSSQRFKDEIKSIEKASEAILALKPVSFRYKHEIDPKRIPQFGLVAEEVEKVNPDLVVRDENDEIYTVRYDAVNVMLLNEFLKEHRRVAEQEATIAQLRKEMKAVVARLEEHDSKIQRVSDELGMSRPRPQIVLNDQ